MRVVFPADAYAKTSQKALLGKEMVVEGSLASMKLKLEIVTDMQERASHKQTSVHFMWAPPPAILPIFTS